MLPPFRLARPDTVDEALALLSEESVPYCGGTELLLAMRMGLLRPDALVDLKRIAALRVVRREGEHLVIGAAVTHMDLADDPLVRESVPMLARVARTVGNPRVRAQGTVGGNLCFAEPKSDVTTALLALEVTLTLASPSGRRELGVAEFLRGAYWTDRQPDELLVDVRVPLGRWERGVYRKYQTMERPTVGVAVALGDGSPACRLVVGAVSETPLAFDVDALEDVDVEDVAARVEPVPDLTGSVRYKRHVTACYVRRAVDALLAGGDDR